VAVVNEHKQCVFLLLPSDLQLSVKRTVLQGVVK